MPRNYAPLPWQKTFHKIPEPIAAALAASDSTFVRVGCSKHLTAQAIRDGAFKHLRIETERDITEDWSWLIPSPNVGPASYRNATPLEKRVEPPVKIAKRIRGRAPNWQGGGFHHTVYERQVWMTRLAVPAMLRLGFQRAGPSTADGIPVRFQIEESLNRSNEGFSTELLHRLNLLQENAGAVDLHPADASAAEFAARAAEEMGWDILPQTNLEDKLVAITRKAALLEPGRERIASDRLAVIRALKPRRVWHSKRGYVGYFMVEYADNLAVFEHLEVDHAMYVVHENAAELSQLTRSQLREKLGAGVERIIHQPGWDESLGRLVRAARGEPIDALL